MAAGLRLIPYTPEEKGEWDSDIASHEGTTVFHTSAWLDAVGEAMSEGGVGRAEVVLLRILRGEEQVGEWPGMLLRVGPLRAFGSPFPGWQTRELGPVYEGCDATEVLAALGDYARRNRVVHVELADRQLDAEMMEGLGYRRVPLSTWVLDLTQGSEGLWTGMKGRARTAVRYAEKHGVIVEDREDEGFVDDYWRLTLATYARQDMAPPLTRERVEGLVRSLRAAGQVRMLSGHFEGKAICAGIFPYDDRSVYYWGGASDPEHNRLSANNLLQWELIQCAVGRRLQTYDLYGAGVARLDKFKSSFGAELVECNHWVRSRLPGAEAARRAYRKLASLRRR